MENIEPLLSQRAMDMLEVREELELQMHLETDLEQKELFRLDIEYIDACLLFDSSLLSS